jgi:hypothetical protein
MRIPLYLRPGKDEVLINYFNEQTRSETANHLARELMMDGLRYRQNTIESKEINLNQPTYNQNKSDLSKIQLTEKEISQEELEKNLDDF